MAHDKALAITKALQAAKPAGITVSMDRATAEGQYKITLRSMGEPVKTWAEPVTLEDAMATMLAMA